MAGEDELFKSAAPNLFGEGFKQKMKDQVDSVKVLSLPNLFRKGFKQKTKNRMDSVELLSKAKALPSKFL